MTVTTDVSGRPNVSASDVALPVYDRLRAVLPGILADDPAGDLTAPDDSEWFRLPSPAALRAARTPAVAVIVDGLTGPPTYSRRTGYTATWDVTVVVYVRGGDYDETRSRVERYVAAIRAALLSSPQGIARRWQWFDEHYDQVTEPGAARTLGAGYLAITVEVEGASIPALIGADPANPSEFTKTATTIRPSRGAVEDL